MQSESVSSKARLKTSVLRWIDIMRLMSKALRWGEGELMSQYRVECNHCRLDFYCSLATPLFVVYRLPYGGSVSRSAVFLCRPIASKGRLIDRRVGLKLSSLNEGHTSTSLMSSKERFLDSQVSLRSTRVIPLIWCLSLHYLVQFPLRS